MHLAICAIILKAYAQPYLEHLNQLSSQDAFASLYNTASDEGNEEILEILDYIEKTNLIGTFFRD